MSGIPTRNISFSPRWEETGQGKRKRMLRVPVIQLTNWSRKKRIVFDFTSDS